jgi:hypothetical protein
MSRSNYRQRKTGQPIWRYRIALAEKESIRTVVFDLIIYSKSADEEDS